jgi:hypothetical protein
METIVDQLRGGSRRSLGRANAVARQISRDPKLFALVFEAMLHDESVVRMRSAIASARSSHSETSYRHGQPGDAEPRPQTAEVAGGENNL